MIGPNSIIISSDHIVSLSRLPFQEQGFTRKKIIIGSDVWVGGNVSILAGSSIEDRVVVAAGSVVRGNLESGFFYAGSPAKKIKPIPKITNPTTDVFYKDWSAFNTDYD